MTKASQPSTPIAVVFDLGGVMAEICHTWEDAAECAGVRCSRLTGGPTKLTELPELDKYQAGEISLDEYLYELSQFVGCTFDEALKVHNGILVAEYPGMGELVDELRTRGLRTGCLSNTNPPHWDVLALNGQYPAIVSLDMKMASHLVGINKPDPRIYALFCETFCLRPEAIAFFDDGHENVDSAARCGWKAAWIDPSKDTPAQVRTHLLRLGVT